MSFDKWHYYKIRSLKIQGFFIFFNVVNIMAYYTPIIMKIVNSYSRCVFYYEYKYKSWAEY
ncbi:hypothetical protein [Clostridium rectalis]|uniref:hypothetical protein n=1 Tax=Clostridium rectalis TaxID=2040295 RepID=UPI0013DDD0BC|nr:hypothetical protein [Clostridium rectalis]